MSRAQIVAVSFDDRIARHAVRTLNSLSRNATRDRDVVILARNWRPWTKAYFRALELPRLRLRILDMTAVSFSRGLRLLAHTTAATMDRLFLPALLPAAGRVLYLDVDLVCLADVGPLFDLDLPESGIAAKPSITERYATLSRLIDTWAGAEDRAAIRAGLASHGVPEAMATFNAGVLVMDLPSLRRRGFLRETVRFVTEYGVNDQLAMNLYARGEFARIDPSWNVFVGQDSSESPRIVHWPGPTKPWRSRDVPFREQWDAYAIAYDPMARLAGRLLGKRPVNPLERVEPSTLMSHEGAP